ncbi:cupin domain-containing protein [Rhizobium sp. NLR15a]|nr:cupin domain-containing protein [Rhizobium bangladeshense]MBX5297596.1 cupin domain-containing protein [Rhizobium sp. NLR15a]
MVFMPPGRIARPHFHARSDIIVMVLEGFAASLIGPDLKPVFHGPGEFIYIPEGVVHVAVNLSTQNRLIAVEARTDPKFNEDVVLSSEYDERASEIVADLHRMFASGELEILCIGMLEKWDRFDLQMWRRQTSFHNSPKATSHPDARVAASLPMPSHIRCSGIEAKLRRAAL